MQYLVHLLAVIFVWVSGCLSPTVGESDQSSEDGSFLRRRTECSKREGASVHTCRSQTCNGTTHDQYDRRRGNRAYQASDFEYEDGYQKRDSQTEEAVSLAPLYFG
jgi:hypothetical protein